MATVEFHQAFLWTCEDCGRDNFTRAIAVDPATMPPDELAEARDAFGIEDGEDGCLLRAPGRVKCGHCKAEFAAEEP